MPSSLESCERDGVSAESNYSNDPAFRRPEYVESHSDPDGTPACQKRSKNTPEIDFDQQRSNSRALPLMSLNHVSYICASPEKSLIFYRDVLGFWEIQRPKTLTFPGHWLLGYGLGIHLIQGKTSVGKAEKINVRSDHIAFQTERFDDVVQRLIDGNIPHEKALLDEGSIKIRQVFFHDPDHNMIEVTDCHNFPAIIVPR